MHLGMSIRYTLKNRDKDYRGITGEQASYCSKEAAPFEDLAVTLVCKTLGYYMLFQDTATLNTSLDKLRAALETLKVVEEHIEPDSDDLPDIFDMHHDLLDLP